MIQGRVTWEVRDDRAVYNGRLLAEWVDPLVAEVVAEFDPVEVWLFGSLARGDDNGHSDIDLLIVLDAYDPAAAIALERRARMAATVPVPFDAAFTDPARLQHRRRVAGTLERAVALDGRRLHARR